MRGGGAAEAAHIYDSDEDDPRLAARDSWLEKKIHEELAFLYPGHPWLLTVRHRHGYIKLCLPVLMDIDYDMKIGTYWRTHGKALFKVAGEILERFEVPRARFDQDQMANAAARFGQAEMWRKTLPGGI